MALTVDEAFSQFNRDIVNLIPDRVKIGRSSRDWLVDQLISLPSKIDDFPRLFDGMHVNFGSFSRNTKIDPLDDIDLILTFSADGTTYLTQVFGQSYQLLVPESAANLRKLVNQNETLNSIRLVNKLVSSLSEIEHYKKAEIHRRQEAATLGLSSYEWNFDIVPAFYTDTGYYLIPDGSGSWKATDPRIDQERIASTNKAKGGRINQLIRTLKYWSWRASMPRIPSYLFENLVLRYVETQISAFDYVDLAMRDFWSYLSSAIHSSVDDPNGFAGNINNLSFSDRLSIAAKSQETYEKARAAARFEIDEKDQRKAINKWKEIFGDKFPSYD